MRFSDLIPPRWFYYLKLPFKYWAYELIDQFILHFVPAGKGKAVLIYRLDLIGDYLMSRPFFQAIAGDPAFAGLSFSFAGNQVLKSLAEELDAGVFSEFIWIDRSRFINSISYRFQVLAGIRRRGFSMVIYPSHTRQFWLESLVRVSGAAHRITASPVGRYMSTMEAGISEAWYNRVIDTGSQPLFEFYRNQSFFKALASSAGQSTSLKDARMASSAKENRILLAPGASTDERKWPADNFVRLVRELQEIFPGFTFGIIGSQQEFGLCSGIAEKAGPAVVNFAGKCSLPRSMQLLAESCLLISNESSPVHMAATTGTACVCISNGNHFSRWNPYPESLASNILTCYPARFGNVQENHAELTLKYHHHSSLTAAEVPFEAVLQASVRLLKGDFS